MQVLAVNAAEPEIVTMRRLSQDTSGVMTELVEGGHTAVVTKRGRFIALIVPIAPGVVEAAALDQVVSSAVGFNLRLSVTDAEDDEAYSFTPEEAAKALGVAVPDSQGQ